MYYKEKQKDIKLKFNIKKLLYLQNLRKHIFISQILCSILVANFNLYKKYRGNRHEMILA